jgi:hypothetical protein
MCMQDITLFTLEVGKMFLGNAIPILSAFAQGLVGSSQFFHDLDYLPVPILGIGSIGVEMLFQSCYD